MSKSKINMTDSLDEFNRLVRENQEHYSEFLKQLKEYSHDDAPLEERIKKKKMQIEFIQKYMEKGYGLQSMLERLKERLQEMEEKKNGMV